MKLFRLLILIGVPMFSATAFSQVLTVDEAVARALKNDFDIQLSRNEASIAKANNTPGNAGMLPELSATVAAGYDSKRTTQELADHSEREYNPLNSKVLSAGVQLSWTFFDGGKMFVTKNKLAQIERLGEIEFQSQVLQTTADVIGAYYDVVRQQQQLRSINEAIKYNRQRLVIANAGFQAGSLSKSDLLQAQIDLNLNLENAINQQYNIQVAQRALNKLLRYDSEMGIMVSDSIPCHFRPDSISLLQKLDNANTSILAFRKQVEIAGLNVKESRTAYLPVLSMNGGMFASDVQNSAGSLLQNRTMGPQVSGTLSVPLYQAGEVKRKLNIAKIELQSANVNLEKMRQLARIDMQNAITNYRYQMNLLDIEINNNQLSEEYLKISIQRFRLGQVNSLEVHLAQENFVQSNTRLINYRFNLKMAETRLKQLSSLL